MYELVALNDRDYYIESPTKIGLVRLGDAEVCLIDSGNDKDAGRKVRQILDAKGWKLRAIYNTHSHADHIGGNKYLQAQTGCAVYAPGVECALTCYPLLEPSLLYGGCPPADLRHKFLLAQASDARPLTAQTLPAGFSLVPLPGHTTDMVGLMTPDGTFYIGDSLASEETLDKYKITYIFDVPTYLDTLEGLTAMSAKTFVPAHAAAAEDIAPLARYNIDRVRDVAETILSLCRTPATFESILRALFAHYDLNMNFQQHFLVGSTVRSFLAWLKDTGRVDVDISDNTLLWHEV